MHGSRRGILSACVLVAIFFSSRQGAVGCPFCDAPTTTFSEQLASSHAAVLVRWQSAVRAEKTDFADGSTIYETLAASGTGRADFPPGQKITVDRYIAGRSEDECLLFASRQNDKITWGLPLPVSPECWTYLLNTPSRDLPVKERLPFFLAHLEHSDPDIAMDAYSEFAGIPYEALKDLAPKLPREKILHWLNDPLTVPTRKGLFGLMLGLCGTSADAAMMAEIIRQQPEEARMGIDGTMAGYLLLTGDAGLKQLTAWKLNDPNTPDHEVYAFLKALEFLWSYARDSFDTRLLRETLRQMLTRPQLSGLVIIDLARWQDWEIMDQLVASYGNEPYADRHVRQCIIRFLIAAIKDAGEAKPANSSTSYKERAKTCLEQLREQDPGTVKYVERYPFD